MPVQRSSRDRERARRLLPPGLISQARAIPVLARSRPHHPLEPLRRRRALHRPRASLRSRPHRRQVEHPRPKRVEGREADPPSRQLLLAEPGAGAADPLKVAVDPLARVALPARAAVDPPRREAHLAIRIADRAIRVADSAIRARARLVGPGPSAAAEVSQPPERGDADGLRDHRAWPEPLRGNLATFDAPMRLGIFG